MITLAWRRVRWTLCKLWFAVSNIVVRLADGKERAIRYVAATIYRSADGKSISAAEFLERLFGDLSDTIADEDQLRSVWFDPDNREAFLERLEDGVQPRPTERYPPTRRCAGQRPVRRVRLCPVRASAEDPPRARRGCASGRTRRGRRGELRELLLGILRAYEEQGEGELATPKLGSYLTARYGGVGESRGRLGNLSAMRTAFRRMQTSLYAN